MDGFDLPEEGLMDDFHLGLNMENKKFKKLFRLSKENVVDFMQLIEPHLSPCARASSVSVEKKVYICNFQLFINIFFFYFL